MSNQNRRWIVQSWYLSFIHFYLTCVALASHMLIFYAGWILLWCLWMCCKRFSQLFGPHQWQKTYVFEELWFCAYWLSLVCNEAFNRLLRQFCRSKSFGYVNACWARISSTGMFLMFTCVCQMFTFLVTDLCVQKSWFWEHGQCLILNSIFQLFQTHENAFIRGIIITQIL